MEQMLPWFKELKIIEIGCGTGKNTILLAQTAQSIQAISFSEKMLAKAKKTSQDVTFTLADIRSPLPCQNEAAASFVISS